MKDVMQMMSLKGKVAMVTGSASGIGQAISEGLAEAGADIIGIFHNTPCNNTENMVKKTGRKFEPLFADLKEKQSIKKLFHDALQIYGKIDILVNAAGVYEKTTVKDFNFNTYKDNLDLNQNSTLFLNIEAAKYFLNHEMHGRIINIASLESFIGYTNDATASCITQHAIMGITKSMGLQLAQRGITVNAIAPCLIETRMNTRTPEDRQESESLIAARSPMRRWGHPSEVKGIAVLLASAASSFITGQCIVVDGGYLLK